MIALVQQTADPLRVRAYAKHYGATHVRTAASRAMAARWRANNRARILALQRAHYYRHREAILAGKRALYHARRPAREQRPVVTDAALLARRAYARRYYLAHAEACRMAARAAYLKRKADLLRRSAVDTAGK